MKDNWDSRYQHKEMVFGKKPSAFLQELRSRLHAGMRALALGDGEARNGVWLAEQGLIVTSLDWSKIAQDKANRFAMSKRVNIQFICEDVTRWQWPEQQFDVIVSIFFHLPSVDRQPVNRKIVHALKPGGLLILEAFHPDQILRASHGPKDPDMLPTNAQIEKEFSDLQCVINRKQETVVYSSDKPVEHGDAVQYLGLKTCNNATAP